MSKLLIDRISLVLLTFCFATGFMRGVRGLVNPDVDVKLMSAALLWLSIGTVGGFCWLAGKLGDLLQRDSELDWQRTRLDLLRSDLEHVTQKYTLLREDCEENGDTYAGAIKELRRKLYSLEEHFATRSDSSASEQQLARLEDRVHRLAVAVGKLKSEQNTAF